MSWESPEYLVLLLALPAVLFLFFLKRREKYGRLQFSSFLAMQNVTPTLRTQLRELPKILKTIALIFAIIGLARPQKANEKIKKNVEGIDIVMVLDISDSMLIEDMKPVNRLESSKRTIKDFIEKRVSDRIGLIVFSGEAYTRVPMTLDYPVLIQNLMDVKTSRNMKMGTAIGVALAAGVNRIKDSMAKSRVIILLTDGENNTGVIDPMTALKIAKGYNLRVYTIGAGRDGQAQLPIISSDPFGRPVKRYQPIHSKVNDDLLGQIASETGGKYYRATDTKALENVFTDINQLEKTKVEVNRFTQYTELFQSWLIWAVVIYALATILEFTWLRRGV